VGEDLLIVGRGPSVYEHDWDAVHMPVMAVSSGIYGLPETVMPEHFVTLDEPKFFLDSLIEGCDIAWIKDERCRYWPFWREHEIEKHVFSGRVRHGKYRVFPSSEEVLDAIPEEHHKGFICAMAGKLHEFGFQPGWNDWPSVTGWELELKLPPNFTPEGPFGLSEVNNSLFFAIQVGARLGYRNLHFVGIDLNAEGYDVHRETLRKWQPIAEANGVQFINLSPKSALAEWMTTAEWVTA
jgi:hypothetical protein